MCNLLNQSYVLEAFPTFDDAEFSIYHSSVFYKKSLCKHYFRAGDIYMREQ